jgi:hypothetical protein
MIRVLNPYPDFVPIPDPGIKKAPDPGSGSATLPLVKSLSQSTSILKKSVPRENIFIDDNPKKSAPQKLPAT